MTDPIEPPADPAMPGYVPPAVPPEPLPEDAPRPSPGGPDYVPGTIGTTEWGVTPKQPPSRR